MADWLISIEGTLMGQRVALILVFGAAVLHAIFGALQKGRYDPWITRGAIDFWLVCFTLPIALFLVPWPTGSQWALLLGAVVIHFIYKVGVAFGYAYGDFTIVYPITRGTGVLASVIGALLIFDEQYTALQWLGVLVLSGGILAIAWVNISQKARPKAGLMIAIYWALGTGVFVAIYTTYDAYGIRETPNPFTFLMWFFALSSIDFSILGVWRLRKIQNKPAMIPLMLRGQIGALIALGSFGSVMLATRLDKVGEAAALRETSIVFAALIGWLVLGERVGYKRGALICVVACGAILVEFAG